MVSIKNMEMPRSCAECTLCHEDRSWDYHFCAATMKYVDYDSDDWVNERDEECPLVILVDDSLKNPSL